MRGYPETTEGDRMTRQRGIAIWVGVLFLIALVFNVIANEMLGSIVAMPGALAKAFPQRGAVVVGNLLNLICAVAMIFIPIVLFRVVRQKERGLAVAYVVFRALEGILFVGMAIVTLAIIGVSREFVNGGGQNEATLQGVGVALQALRDYGTAIYVVVFSMGACVFYVLLYRTRLLPRFIAIWGFLAAVLILVGAVMGLLSLGRFSDMHLLDGLAFFAPPIALNEIVLALWLIIGGFSSKARHRLPCASVNR